MRGLDPRIHRKSASFKPMDCRVKPGNDGGWVSANSPWHNLR
jgi:plastocyanin